MSKISKKAKITLAIIIIFVAIILLILASFPIRMCISYHNASKWNSMEVQNSTWSSSNSEIIFSFATDTIRGRIYDGKINGRKVSAHFGSFDNDDTTISFFDIDTNELLVKANVTDYSGKKFEAHVIEDNIGLSLNEYTFTID